MPATRKQPPSPRTAQLDGLRALAALSVLCFHVWLYGPAPPPVPRLALTDKLLFELNLGLICFFVLSGFLLYQAFARAALSDGPRVDARRYAVRRAARILPAYYVCLAGCLVLYWAVGLEKMLPAAEHLPLFAVFGQNYSPETVMTFNPVTWTLAVEASLYLALPLIGLAAYRLGPELVLPQAAMLLGLIGVTVIWNMLVFTHGWAPIGRKVLPAYIGHFALGMLAALWVENRRMRQVAPPGAALSAALLALGAGFVFLGGYWHETHGSGVTYATFSGLPAALGFALVIAAAASGRGPAVKWLGARPLVAVGLISYGVYLWHLPLLLAARHLDLLPDAFALRALVVLALSLAAAAASWRWIEKPLIDRYGSAHERARAQTSRRTPRATRKRPTSATRITVASRPLR